MDVNPNAPVIPRGDILINAPLEVVWHIQTDISAWPQWRPQVAAAHFEGHLAVGEEGGL